MNFDLKSPCDGCPFLKQGGVKHLGAARAREIANAMATNQGSTFSCHKTVDYGDDGEAVRSRKEQHCAGGLLFMEKINPGGTNFIRIAERLKMYDRSKLSGSERVFDSVAQMVEAHRR